MFDLLGISGEEQRAKFGFLLDALAMGAPPHGGIAFGIDRMLMVLAGEANLRDTIAFPKNQAGADPMTGAPSDADPEHLQELGIRVIVTPDSSGGPEWPMKKSYFRNARRAAPTRRQGGTARWQPKAQTGQQPRR